MMQEKKKRVSILGFCSDSREWAPYEDSDMEFWGLNRGYVFQRRANAWFDMHSKEIRYCEHRRPGRHTEWLKGFPGPVYMHQADPEIPNSVTYPLAEVAEQIAGNLYRVDKDGNIKSAENEPYLTSSIAQEIALAITEGYDEIHLYGIDLNTDSEYAWQKPGVEYLLGVAAGRGIKVVLPDCCPLLKGRIYGRGFLSPEGERMSLDQLQIRLKSLQKEQQQVSEQINQMLGAKRELEFVQSQMVPGLDHERLDDRRKKMQEGINQLQGRLLQVEGGLKETGYWISQTPAGQEPAEAMAQLRADSEGPITELEAMQAPEPIGEPVLIGG
jgi:hypothetical protein